MARTMRHHARFPRGVEHRLVRLRLDLAEAVHAAHVVHAVHDGAPGVFGNPVPIIESRVTSSASCSSLQPSVPFGPHRQHEEARLGGRIPHADLGVLRQRDAEIGEHAARVLHGARAIRRGLVPDRRQAEHFPRVAGAERAHDHVVALRRVLDRHQMIAGAATWPSVAIAAVRVLQQRLLEMPDRSRPWRRRARRCAGRSWSRRPR